MLNRLVTITSIITYQYSINFTPCRQIFVKITGGAGPGTISFLYFSLHQISNEDKHKGGELQPFV